MDRLGDVFARYFHVLEQTGPTFQRPVVSISMLVTLFSISIVVSLSLSLSLHNSSFFLRFVEQLNQNIKNTQQYLQTFN